MRYIKRNENTKDFVHVTSTIPPTLNKRIEEIIKANKQTKTAFIRDCIFYYFTHGPVDTRYYSLQENVYFLLKSIDSMYTMLQRTDSMLEAVKNDRLPEFMYYSDSENNRETINKWIKEHNKSKS